MGYLYYQGLPNSGMFANFLGILGALQFYDSGYLGGVEVQFEGIYLDPNYGHNWWEYYFEPISLRRGPNYQLDATWCQRYTGYYGPDSCPYLIHCADRSSMISRQRAHQLITRYIHPRPAMIDIVNRFLSEKNLTTTEMIGIHFRGSEKTHRTKESEPVDPNIFFAHLDRILTPTKRIFVATDESSFLQLIEGRYPGRIYSYFASPSIGAEGKDHKPTSGAHQNPWRLGLESVIDMLLLARCSVIIRTTSCLSLVSTFFNPNSTVVTLNHRLRLPLDLELFEKTTLPFL